MKRSVLPLVISVLLTTSTVFSQTLMDYISSVRGDTLVIKDYYEMNNESNSLRFTLMLDTMNVPAGRVYMLKANGYYPSSAITLPPDKAITIVGEDTTILVNNKNPNSAPPIICGEVCESSSFSFGIYVSKELTIKNCALTPAAADQSLGWSIFSFTANDAKLTVDNCIMERTRWTFIGIGSNAANCNVILKNCYFVNISGYYSRLYGSVLDIFTNQDTLLVENCTHIMAQGSLYKFREYTFNKIYFNHNTFINCSGNVIKTLGYQSYMAVTSNLFVNCNVQPYYPGMDYNETDADSLPIGIINVRNLPPEMPQLTRRFYVMGNGVYWDPKLNDMTGILNTNQVNHRTDWTSQMIKMNDRTNDMFNNYEQYQDMTEILWYNELPLFNDSQDLLTNQVDVLKEWSLKAVDTTSVEAMPDWRLLHNGPDNYLYSDWPIPVDLSYTNFVLFRGGVDGLPVGDLNWFPDKKAAWNERRAVEYSFIDCIMNYGWICFDAVENTGNPPKEFKLSQNYPNPFNPSTMISFSIPKDGFVTLKVFNILGQEAATLINGFKKAQTYNVEFNASDLPSGVYVYQVQYGNSTIAKKMILMR